MERTKHSLIDVGKTKTETPKRYFETK